MVQWLKFLLVFFGLLPYETFAQKEFRLNVKMNVTNNSKKTYLIYQLNGKEFIDSSIIKNGAMMFKGESVVPVLATLVLDHEGIGLAKLDEMQTPDFKRFYLYNGTIDLFGKDSVSTAMFVNSKINADYEKYQRINNDFGKKINIIFSELDSLAGQSSPDSAMLQEIQSRADVEYQKALESKKAFISKNPDSYISLVALQEIFSQGVDSIPYLQKLFDGLSDEVKNTIEGRLFVENIKIRRNTEIGAKAVDFTLENTAGKSVKLSDFRGKYVLLDFWASWCKPCRAENPNLRNVYNKYHHKNFDILGVSLDSPNQKEAWLKAVKDDGLLWTQLLDVEPGSANVATLYEVKAIPCNYLIDPQGKIIAKNLRGKELENKLEEIQRLISKDEGLMQSIR